MKLIYVDGNFRKYDQLHVSKAATKVLFYDETENSWGNSLPMSDREKLEYSINETEFKERKWVLLRKNTSGATNEKYRQDGPYSSHEIFNMIGQSTVQLKDPIWKEGMSKWQSIQDTQTFRALKNLAADVETDIADILGSVMEYDPQMRRVEAKKPSPGELGEVFIILDDPNDRSEPR